MAICEIQAVTAYGSGIEQLVDGIYSGKTAVNKNNNLPYTDFPCASVDGLDDSSPRVFQLLERLRLLDIKLPAESPVLLALTIGAVELIEMKLTNNCQGAETSHIAALISLVKKLWGNRKIYVISAACASSASAVAQASSMILHHELKSAIIISCDAVSEFIISGFTSIGALDEKGARPFDANRKGMSLGEAAGIMLLSEKKYAEAGQFPVQGTLRGWRMNCDAFHVTSPDLSGTPLANAAVAALNMANLKPDDISFAVAHGTGTFYNDKMEGEALKRIFPKRLPVFSIKGGSGHTVAPSGMLQLAVALHAKKRGMIPGNINLSHPMEGFEAWVASEPKPINSGMFLSLNSGFGGINCALVIDTA